MRSVQVGPLLVHIAGGPDGQGGGGGPAIILCHGFGAPGTDLVSLSGLIDVGPDVRWFFPEAPIELDMGWGPSGNAWWHIDMVRYQNLMLRGRYGELLNETPDGLDSARDALIETLAVLESTYRVDMGRSVIGGFSQGAMLTTEIALHAPTRFAGVCLFSGCLVSQSRWSQTTPQGLRVFQSHGRHDPILPFAGAEALRALLVERGAVHSWVPFSGQHEIPDVAIEKAGSFCQDLFNSAPAR